MLGHFILEAIVEKREQQKPLSIDDQIKNLKELGLLIGDIDKAKKFLNNVSYYRFIKAYSLEFKSKNSVYDIGTRFETLVELYNFNSDFAHILFKVVERIEIILRCRISNYFSLKYGVLGYEDVDNFENHFYFSEFQEDINVELSRNDKSPIVKNFKIITKIASYRFML